MDLSKIKIIFEGMAEVEKPKPPPTLNDHVKTEGFVTTSDKGVPSDIKPMGTQTIRNPDAAR